MSRNKTPEWLRYPIPVVLGAAVLIVIAWLVSWRPLTALANVVGAAALLYLVVPQFYFMVKNTIDDLKKK